MLLITAHNPCHVSYISRIHSNKKVKIFIILPRHLPRMMCNQRNLHLSQLVSRSIMRRIADLLTAGRRRINLKAVFKPCLTDQVSEDTLGHCAAADVAVANK